ncbi:MAG: aspartate/tyrosine/aromatic aminotransferase [Gammaproteobacteria bacterium]|nr:aspartate/tyrosine/aromatic aminotransferase [Gammaproteobacteria bacterium]
MFETLKTAPADPILGLTEAFKKDPRAEKINLGVGIYKDEGGTTPILSCVKKAESRLLQEESTKSYLGIEGTEEYGRSVQRLLFGNDHPIVTGSRAQSAHAPGGTGALRIAAEFIARQLSSRRIWVSDPTWANHANVFQAAGLEVVSYRYYDADAKDLDFAGMMTALKQVSPGDTVLLHGCCHNPTGIDPTPEQWEILAKCAAEGGWLPLFDFAYQGFATGIDEDAAGLKSFAEHNPEMLIASSFSKNFGLYNERVGCLTLVADDSARAMAAFSQIKSIIRTVYSNPPYHGAGIVTIILNDSALRTEWEGEVAQMRERIRDMRELFVASLKARGVTRDFSFIGRQHGMFSFSGLNPEQVAALKRDHAVYIVGSGRISVAGMTRSNMDALCDAIAKVL